MLLGTPLQVAKAMGTGGADLSNVRLLICDEADKLLGAEALKPLDAVMAACIHPQRVRGPASVCWLISISKTPIKFELSVVYCARLDCLCPVKRHEINSLTWQPRSS